MIRIDVAGCARDLCLFRSDRAWKFVDMRIKRTGVFVSLSLLMSMAATCSVRAEEKAWVLNSFVDFGDGTLVDGGANTYVAADGTVRLINLWDFNNDGNFDLPIACGQDHDERVDLSIYWSDKSGFASDRRTRLPTEGALAAAAEDLNGDGYIDLVVANRFDGEKTNLDSYIYWGSDDGFDASNRSALPTKAAQAVAIADLNGDGHHDIVFANRGVDYHVVIDQFQKSFIYWGSDHGYSAGKRTELPTINCGDVTIADVNHDGHPDILFVNEGNNEAQSGVVVYLGDAAGNYSDDRRIELPGVYSSAVTVADLNQDGHEEIILANMYHLNEKPDPPTGNSVGTYRANSYIYWGSAAGYSAELRTELPTIGARAAAVGDLNGDGLSDIVFANSAEGVSYIYWNSPRGFLAHRRSQILAPSANDVVIEDMNADGEADLILANYASDGFFDTDSYVYWGGPQGFSPDRRLELPTSGASGITIADFDNNGQKDIVFINKIEGVSYPGGTTAAFAELGPTTSWIYLGDDQGRFSPQRRVGLPTVRDTDGYINCDFNFDGFADLLLAQYSTPTHIFWGGPTGLSEDNTTIVPDGQAGTGRAADFNRDGYLDLLLDSNVIYGQESGFSRINRFRLTPRGKSECLADLNGDGWLDVVSAARHKVTLFWNGPGGFDNARTTSLLMQGKDASMPEIADLNGDGYLDLVVVNQVDENKPLGPGQALVHLANPNADAWIYWGSDAGFSESRRSALPTIGANDVVAADLNRNGYIDLFFPSYLGGTHRHFPGTIYWNSADGFDVGRQTRIPGYSGCGTFAADCNLDGYPELVIANHTRVGNHRSDVWVYQGSPDGYSPDKRTSLPATGPHFFSLVDIGNIYDRSERYDYLSPPFDAGSGADYERISWKADTPFHTRLEFQIRTAESEQQLTSAGWRGPAGADSFYRTSGTQIAAAKNDRWIQFKASLISPNMANTPVLRSATISYSKD